MQNVSSPYFSVIIPTLNEEKYISDLLDDLNTQTFQNFEVIVVDGLSEDGTAAKVNSYKSKLENIVLITSNKRNVSFQRNAGAKDANSPWLIFMDSDNRIPSYFLQGLKYYTEKDNPDIISTWIEPDTNNRKDKAIATIVNIAIDILNTGNNPGVLEAMVCIKRNKFNALRGFNEKLHWGEGHDLIKRAKSKRLKLKILRTLKYKYSFRRIRKQGTFNVLRNLALNEISILTNKSLPKERAEKLYPMEGGKYYIVDKSEQGKIEKIFLDLMIKTQTQIGYSYYNVIKRLILKIFNRLN